MDVLTLQVLISTAGRDALERIARNRYPVVKEVEYIISWQDDGDEAIPYELCRTDIKIFRNGYTGLSANRNEAFALSTAPLLLISDDDISYKADDFKKITDAFCANPEAGIMLFNARGAKKSYPLFQFDFKDAPVGYYATSCEIAIRQSILKIHKLNFDRRFGIGGDFCCGEETVFLWQAMRSGVKIIYMPVDICDNYSPTTSDRLSDTGCIFEAEGAILAAVHPRSCYIRIAARTMRRLLKSPSSVGIYFISNLRGIRKLLKSV